MGYLEQSLTSGEVVLFRTRRHWSVLAWPFTAALVCVGVAIALFVAGGGGAGAIAGVLFLVLAIVAAATGWVRRSSIEMAVTNRRVLMKTGILSRRTVEVLLSKVESIGVDQSVMGRVADFGSVVVRGTGGTHELFERMAHPLEFRRQVQEQIDKLHLPNSV